MSWRHVDARSAGATHPVHARKLIDGNVEAVQELKLVRSRQR